MKFKIAFVALVCWAGSSFAQSCSGGHMSFNIRERHVTRSHAVAPRTGCSGGFAMMPVTTYRPVTKYVPVAVAPQAAPVVAAPVNAAPMPVVAAPTFVVETPQPLRAFPKPISGLISRIAALLHLSAEKARAVVAVPVHRVFEIHTTRERHLFRGRCP